MKRVPTKAPTPTASTENPAPSRLRTNATHPVSTINRWQAPAPGNKDGIKEVITVIQLNKTFGWIKKTKTKTLYRSLPVVRQLVPGIKALFQPNSKGFIFYTVAISGSQIDFLFINRHTQTTAVTPASCLCTLCINKKKKDDGLSLNMATLEGGCNVVGSGDIAEGVSGSLAPCVAFQSSPPSLPGSRTAPDLTFW